LGLKEISTTNEGDKHFASLSQARNSEKEEEREIQRQSIVRFYYCTVTRDRADLRISFACPLATAPGAIERDGANFGD